MKRVALSIAVFAVIALAVVFQMQSVRADSGVVSPGKPSDVSAQYLGESSISVSWNASPREGTAILYEVFYRQSGTSEWTPAIAEYTGTTGVAYSTDHPIVVPTLGEYQVRVKACNYYVGSTILCDNSAVATVQVGALPAKPKGLKLTQAGRGHNINVRWDAVEDADNYKIRWRAADATLGDPTYSTTTRTTIHLDKYGEWVVRVQACNDAGCGKPASKTVTTQKLAPPAPSGVTAETSLNSLTIRLAWDFVYVRGEEIFYKTKLSPPNTGAYYESQVLHNRGHTRINTTLEAWRGYGKYSAGAVACVRDDANRDICSPIAKTDIVVEGTTPEAISNFEATDAGRNYTAMAVSWDKTEYATKYEIKWRKRREGFRHQDVLTVSGNKTSAEIRLPEAHDWVVRARACNANLCGPWVTTSANVVVIIKAPVVVPIENLRVSMEPNFSGTAYWDHVEGVTHYKTWYPNRYTGVLTLRTIPVKSPDYAAEVGIIWGFEVPVGAGLWDFVVQGCNDGGCFAAGHTLVNTNPPE